MRKFPYFFLLKQSFFVKTRFFRIILYAFQIFFLTLHIRNNKIKIFEVFIYEKEDSYS